MDFGSILDRTIGAYESVSVARIDRDTAKYMNAGQAQANALHSSEAMTPTEAYSTGNAVNPASNAKGFLERNGKPLMVGAALLVSVGLAIKAMRG